MLWKLLCLNHILKSKFNLIVSSSIISRTDQVIILNLESLIIYSQNDHT
jgi:hypothetical protein